MSYETKRISLEDRINELHEQFQYAAGCNVEKRTEVLERAQAIAMLSLAIDAAETRNNTEVKVVEVLPTTLS